MARRTLPALVCVAALVAGCGSGSGSTTVAQTTSNATDSSGPVRIVMQSLDFSPIDVEAKVGQTVVWTNQDQAPHNVTWVSGPRFASSRRMMALGDSFSIKLTQPGTIHYVCTLHAWMKATIIVSQ